MTQRLNSFAKITMGLSTLQAMPFSKLPKALSPTPTPSHSPPLTQPSLPLRQSPSSRPISLRHLLPRATPSEETSNGPSNFFDEKRDGGGVIVNDVKPEDDKSFNESYETVDTKTELPLEDQGLPLEFLDKLNVKFDADDTGSVVLYGAGAIVALWLTSAVINAIDSIPLVPKLLEVVGLGYTIWFSSRYLIFKKNRDELVSKIEELKGQVLGSEDK